MIARVHFRKRGEYARATMGKSPLMFAFSRYSDPVYSVTRDTRAAGDFVLSDVTVFLAQTDVSAASSRRIARS